MSYLKREYITRVDNVQHEKIFANVMLEGEEAVEDLIILQQNDSSDIESEFEASYEEESAPFGCSANLKHQIGPTYRHYRTLNLKKRFGITIA
ncbi:hypothetical protein HHI36_006332 [Cryptolaemus montrouzieri]|uniref:Uncharacterized protein n=1 Tax=Cryptolaemus montrouzieri TaxID=559131 RepID=A0ABD2NX26_9CUCU